MLAGRAVDAAGAVGGGAAPDALVAAGAVAVLARGRVDATRTIARRAAPLAVLLVVAVLVLSCRTMYAARTVARASAVSAFRTHILPPMVYRSNRKTPTLVGRLVHKPPRRVGDNAPYQVLRLPHELVP